MVTDREQQEAVFMDKYRLSFNILEQEGMLVSLYSEITRKLIAGYYDNETITKTETFFDCWATLINLYNFMKNNKLEELRKKNKEDVENIERWIEEIELKAKPTMEDLRKCFKTLTKLISKAGYHDDKLQKDEELSDYDLI